MYAVILAAGRGSRFLHHSESTPKPLLLCAGLTLIERVILTLREAGITQFIVVTGYKGEDIKNHLVFDDRYNISLKFVDCPDWEKGNGVSALAGIKNVPDGENYILSMSDHLYSRELPAKLIQQSKHSRNAHYLAVDYDIHNIADLDDATKVWVDANGYIRAIGKRLDDFNAIDCGVFLGNETLKNALEEAIAQGNYTLTDGNRLLAERNQFYAVDISGCDWVDVDDNDSLIEAERQIIRQCLKKKDGIVSKLINRRLSLGLTRYLLNTSLSPNAISLLNLVFLLGAAGAALGGYWISAGILSWIYSIVDGVDGEIARIKHKGTWLGSWLDGVLDRVADWTLLVSCALGSGHSPKIVFLLFFTLTVDFLYRLGSDLAIISGSLLPQSAPAQSSNWFSRKNIVPGFTHDVFMFVLSVFCLLGTPLLIFPVVIVCEIFDFFLRTGRRILYG